MSTMAPDRRAEIVQLGVRSLLSGTLTSCLIGSVIGIVGG
jgi:CNT family concentrative nucleoside transporter